MRQRYQHSGRVPPLGLALGLGLGLAASVPLAYLYDYGIINVPSVKLRFLFTMIFGALAGMAAGWGLMLGKVRNSRIAGVVGIMTSAAALYISWATWLIMVFEKPYSWLPRVLLRPAAIWHLARVVNENGTWSTSGSPTKGTELWIIWMLEALTVLICGLGGAYLVMKALPFCENCDHWCRKAGQVLIAAKLVPAELMTRVNQEGLGFLAEASPAERKQPHYTLTWHSCTSCGTLNTLSVIVHQPKNNKELASHLLISAAEVDALKNFQGRTRSLATPAAAGSVAR
ncbi:MAG TPA: hypothetical protein VKW06_14775 [Candidatus Angelobacter sp.]|nr:hypothetical protein [Candidatus Angelobacter sp.]